MNVGKVAIDGDIRTVANHDNSGPTETEYGTDLTGKDATHGSTGRALDVDTIVRQVYAFQSFNAILSIMADDTTGERHRQTSLVVGKATAESTVGTAERLAGCCFLTFFPTAFHFSTVTVGLCLALGSQTCRLCLTR